MNEERNRQEILRLFEQLKPYLRDAHIEFFQHQYWQSLQYEQQFPEHSSAICRDLEEILLMVAWESGGRQINAIVAEFCMDRAWYRYQSRWGRFSVPKPRTPPSPWKRIKEHLRLCDFKHTLGDRLKGGFLILLFGYVFGCFLFPEMWYKTLDILVEHNEAYFLQYFEWLQQKYDAFYQTVFISGKLTL